MSSEAWTILASGVLSLLLGLVAGLFKRGTKSAGSSGSSGVTTDPGNSESAKPEITTGLDAVTEGLGRVEDGSKDVADTIQRGLDIIERIKARNAEAKAVGASGSTDVVPVGLSVRSIRGLEDFLASLGSESCKYLCYLSIAEEATGKNFDLVCEAVAAIARKELAYNWDNPKDPINCTVLDGIALLKHLTGKNWKETRDKVLHNEYRFIIEHWQRTAKTAGGEKVYNHFRRPDWDPLLASVTVAQGAIKEYCYLSYV